MIAYYGGKKRGHIGGEARLALCRKDSPTREGKPFRVGEMQLENDQSSMSNASKPRLASTLTSPWRTISMVKNASATKTAEYRNSTE